MKIINYEKKEMIPLTDEENESYEKQKVCYICIKEFNTDEDDKKEFTTDENDRNAFKPYNIFRYHCHYTEKRRKAALNICNLTSKKIPVIFHTGFTYNYHFIINQLAKGLRVSLNAWEKIQKNILLFQYQLTKS